MPHSSAPEEGKGKIKLFEGRQVRTIWDEQNEKWWFSVVDVIGILTDQPDYAKVRNYWKWLKNKLIAERSELVSDTNQLKMPAPDGKMRHDCCAMHSPFKHRH